MKHLQKNVLKRFLALSLGVCMIFGLMPVSASAEDLGSHWARGTINDFLERGIVNGYSDGTVRPNNPVSRAEMMTMTNRSMDLSNLVNVSYSTLNFNDVKSNDWFYNDVRIAVTKGYVAGDTNGSVRPNAYITREEAAVMLCSVLGLSEDVAAANEFVDGYQMSSWAKGKIGALVEGGYVNGYPDGTFKPKAVITRAEAMVMIKNIEGGSERTSDYVPLTSTDKLTVAANQTFGGSSANDMKEVSDITVTGSNATLQNLIVSGDLTISASVNDGDVYLNNVTVKGVTNILGGGRNSIEAADCDLGTVYVAKKSNDVRVAFSGKTTAKSVTYRNGGVFEAGKDSEVSSLIIGESVPKGSTVSISGNIDLLTVNASNVKVVVTSGTISKLAVDSSAASSTINLLREATVTNAVVNAKVSFTGQGTIKLADITVTGVTMEKRAERYASGSKSVTTGTSTSNNPSGIAPTVIYNNGSGSSYYPPSIPSIPDTSDPTEVSVITETPASGSVYNNDVILVVGDEDINLDNITFRGMLTIVYADEIESPGSLVRLSTFARNAGRGKVNFRGNTSTPQDKPVNLKAKGLELSTEATTNIPRINVEENVGSLDLKGKTNSIEVPENVQVTNIELADNASPAITGSGSVANVILAASTTTTTTVSVTITTTVTNISTTGQGNIGTINIGGSNTTTNVTISENISVSQVAVTGEASPKIELNGTVSTVISTSTATSSQTSISGSGTITTIITTSSTTITTTTTVTNPVIVARTELNSIAITSLPTKTKYSVGELLDLSGMIITGTYDIYENNNRLTTVTQVIGQEKYTSRPANRSVLNNAGNIPVIINVNDAGIERSATFTVAVSSVIKPTVTAVSVDPATVTIPATGGTQQFTAIVTGTGSPSQNVIWSIPRTGLNTNTAIDSSGLLTVNAADAGKTITVKATSAADITKSGTATVTVVTGTTVNVVGVSVSNVATPGKYVAGELLTATLTYGSGTPNVNYQWKRCDNLDGSGTVTNIGLNQNTYTLTADDAGKYVYVEITAGTNTTVTNGTSNRVYVSTDGYAKFVDTKGSYSVTCSYLEDFDFTFVIVTIISGNAASATINGGSAEKLGDNEWRIVLDGKYEASSGANIVGWGE